jgi:hypothetical protein
MFVANCVQTRICVHTICDKQGSVSTHTVCDKQGFVFTQVVTNRDLCPHSLQQTGICFQTVCDKQWSVSTQFVTNRGHRSLFVINCVDTDPCLSLIVWTQIPVCHNLCGHRSLLVTNYVDTDPCLPPTVWTQIPVCQGSVSTQFMTNKDLCPYNLWQTGICVHTHSLWQTGICFHTGCDKQWSVSTTVWTQILVCHKLWGHKYLFITNCVSTDLCLS